MDSNYCYLNHPAPITNKFSPPDGLEEEGHLLTKCMAQDKIIIKSESMKQVVKLAIKVARVDSSVLITGETGVGKEVLARVVHKHSCRVNGPFIKLNCGAIQAELVESELFGYEPGAFTGARREGKPGLIELADGGTLFLDEIGDLPLNLQVKFLRVLQEREIQRVGGVETKGVNFRLIAATNKLLEDLVKQNKFREDLFYRLDVIPMTIPPLRERKEDILPLALYFLNKFSQKYGLSMRITPEVVAVLLNNDWPGNVRELENTIERLLVTGDTDVAPDHLIHKSSSSNEYGKSCLNLRDILDETEKHLILQAFEQCKTTREMAEVLGISQSTVVKKMRKHDI